MNYSETHVSPSRPTLSLAGLTLPGLAPTLLVEAAADAGYDAAGVNLNQLWRTVAGDSRWFAAEIDNIAKTVSRRGVFLSHGGHLLLGALDRQSVGYVVAAMHRLKVRHVVLVADPHASSERIEEDFSYVRANIDEIPLLVEFAPYTGWRNLEDAMHFIETHAADRLELVVDVLHLVRSNSLPTLLARDSWPVGLIQMCDAPLKGPQLDGMHMEARGNRLDVGEGGLPLGQIFGKLPKNAPLEVEAPCLALRNLSPTARAVRSYQHLTTFLRSEGYLIPA